MPVLEVTLIPQGIQWAGVKVPRRKGLSPTEGDLLEELWVHVTGSETTINVIKYNESHLYVCKPCL